MKDIIITCAWLVFVFVTAAALHSPRPHDGVRDKIYLSGPCATGWYVEEISNEGNYVVMACDPPSEGDNN